MIKNGIFTSESVLPGHPDKICDRISDSILDFYLKKDKNARVAAECFVTTNTILIGGETKSSVEVKKEELNKVALDAIKDFGENGKFNSENIKITNLIHSQSQDIAIGVDANEKRTEGAGDQGMMFGFACDENEECMPSPIFYAHKIVKKLHSEIKSGGLKGFGPDGKTQLSFEYKDGKPVALKTAVLSIQHREDFKNEFIEEKMKDVLKNVIPSEFTKEEPKIHINATGRFVIGGPDGDAGLTGRKIIVDTYGGFAPHGGGAFSGKDATKVDRSGAYIARFIAKNIIKSGLATHAMIQLSYCIGRPDPTSILIDTFGTGKIPNSEICKLIEKNIDLTPRGIINKLDLQRPIYYPTAHFGHFGHHYNESDGLFPWERIEDGLFI